MLCAMSAATLNATMGAKREDRPHLLTVVSGIGLLLALPVHLGRSAL